MGTMTWVVRCTSIRTLLHATDRTPRHQLSPRPLCLVDPSSPVDLNQVDQRHCVAKDPQCVRGLF